MPLNHFTNVLELSIFHFFTICTVMYCTVFYHYFAFTSTIIVTISHPCRSLSSPLWGVVGGVWYPANVGPSQLQLGLQLGGVGPFQFQFRAYVGQGVQLGLLAGSGVGPIEHHLGRWGVCGAPSPIRAMKVWGSSKCLSSYW